MIYYLKLENIKFRESDCLSLGWYYRYSSGRKGSSLKLTSFRKTLNSKYRPKLLYL